MNNDQNPIETPAEGVGPGPDVPPPGAPRWIRDAVLAAAISRHDDGCPPCVSVDVDQLTQELLDRLPIAGLLGESGERSLSVALWLLTEGNSEIVQMRRRVAEADQSAAGKIARLSEEQAQAGKLYQELVGFYQSAHLVLDEAGAPREPSGQDVLASPIRLVDRVLWLLGQYRSARASLGSLSGDRDALTQERDHLQQALATQEDRSAELAGQLQATAVDLRISSEGREVLRKERDGLLTRVQQLREELGRVKIDRAHFEELACEKADCAKDLEEEKIGARKSRTPGRPSGLFRGGSAPGKKAASGKASSGKKAAKGKGKSFRSLGSTARRKDRS